MTPPDLIRIPLTTPFANGSVNAYLIKGKTMTLVDVGMPGQQALQQLKDGLLREGVRLEDLDQIILTHLHTDHAGGIATIHKEREIPIMVHQSAKRHIEGGKAYSHQIQKFFHLFIEEAGASSFFSWKRHDDTHNWQKVTYLKEGESIPAGDRDWQIHYVPGHSQTDLLLWEPNTGAAIVGDHLLKEISSNAFVEPPTSGEARPKPLLQYRDSMKFTKTLPLQTLFPGHGAPFAGHLELIDQRFSEQETRCQAIQKAIEAGHTTVYQISQSLFPRLKNQAIFLGLSEIQGHLDLMVERSVVKTQTLASVIHYQMD